MLILFRDFILAAVAMLVIYVALFGIYVLLYSIPWMRYSYKEPELYKNSDYIGVTFNQIKTYYALAPDKYTIKVIEHNGYDEIDITYIDDNDRTIHLVPENKKEFSKTARWVEAMKDDMLNSGRTETAGNYLRSVKKDLDAYKKETDTYFKKASDIVNTVKTEDKREENIADLNLESKDIVLNL